MWNYLYALWRSVLRRSPEAGAPDRSAGDSPRDALHEELRRLLEKRSTLQKTVACYLEFEYEDPAERVREELAATDRRIAAIRLQLRLKHPVPGRS